MIGEGGVVGGRVGEEKLVFIGKKKLEKKVRSEFGFQTGAGQDTGLQGNPSRSGL